MHLTDFFFKFLKQIKVRTQNLCGECKELARFEPASEISITLFTIVTSLIA